LTLYSGAAAGSCAIDKGLASNPKEAASNHRGPTAMHLERYDDMLAELRSWVKNTGLDSQMGVDSG
jgi:hypothetical protein